MAIGRQILSGLFGATAGGLSGFAQQKAEERARMQRQMEREEERAYQRGLVAETRRYQEALAAQEGLMRGDLVPARRLAPEPEAEVATPESTAETLKSFITGARMGGAGLGLARGATDAAPFMLPDTLALGEKDRRDLRAVGGVGASFQTPASLDAIVRRPEPLKAEYAKPETTAPERQVIELAGKEYEIVTSAERQARALEAERGGLDAIEVARLREVARGSEASPEREEARAALSDIGVSYRTEEETRAIERVERLRDAATAREQKVIDSALETLSKANLASFERYGSFLSPDVQAELIAPLIEMGGLPPEMVARVVDASSAMQITPAPSAGEGGGAGTPTEAEASTRRESYLNTLDTEGLSAALERVVAGESIRPEQILTPSITRQQFEENVQPRMREVDRLLEKTRNEIKLAQSSGSLGLGPNVGELKTIESELIKRKNQIIKEAGGSVLPYHLGGPSPYRMLERGGGD